MMMSMIASIFLIFSTNLMSFETVPTFSLILIISLIIKLFAATIRPLESLLYLELMALLAVLASLVSVSSLSSVFLITFFAMVVAEACLGLGALIYLARSAQGVLTFKSLNF